VSDTTAEQILPPIVWTWQHESHNSEYSALKSVQALLSVGSGTPVSISMVATPSSLEGTYNIGFISTRALKKGKKTFGQSSENHLIAHFKYISPKNIAFLIGYKREDVHTLLEDLVQTHIEQLEMIQLSSNPNE